MSLEGDFYSCDTNDEKEVKYGDSIDIDDEAFTHSLLSISLILDSNIYVPDPSHFVHASLIDGAQPNVFLDFLLSKSSPISVYTLTIIGIM